ncbi:helix-turn-helix domain-containing protein [Halosimplex salinum]|uniref:helix-turn-helix domain-containing protein n=1 Tax=Halosimplex salinum TaxID=1710538 RepID=UPI000F4942BC|nr:helix-turn-helix domain-containing protein [Halosimplex salinum]
MSTIVKATLPAEQFALAETFETVPDVEFDAVRLVTHGTDRVVPLLWATDGDSTEVEAALEADGSTDDVALVSRRNHDSLFKMRWTARVRFVTHVLVEAQGAVVSARGTTDGWTFRVLFPEHDAVSTTYDACEEQGIDLDVTQIYHLDDAPSLGGFHLTDQQFKTVRTALERGYYEVPRETTLEELATELDVSHQALSERLRRGHLALIENVVGP